MCQEQPSLPTRCPTGPHPRGHRHLTFIPPGARLCALKIQTTGSSRLVRGAKLSHTYPFATRGEG